MCEVAWEVNHANEATYLHDTPIMRSLSSLFTILHTERHNMVVLLRVWDIMALILCPEAGYVGWRFFMAFLCSCTQIWDNTLKQAMVISQLLPFRRHVTQLRKCS